MGKETVLAATAAKGINLSVDWIVKLLIPVDDEQQEDNPSSMHWRELHKESPLKLERSVLEVDSEDMWIIDALLEVHQPSKKMISHGLNSVSPKENSDTSI